MAEAIQTIVDMLKGDWDSDNTSSETPNIEAVFDTKRIAATVKQSEILCYAGSPETRKYNGLGASAKDTTDTISIDIRCIHSRTRALLIKAECERIVHANRKNPSADFMFLEPLRFTDLCDRSRGLHRWVFDVRLSNWGINL
jgi:hypothetical protein